MTQNPSFAVQLLEKIGTPLAGAIEAVPLQGENQEVEAAKLMAQMLGQAVQVSISLNTTLDLKEDEQQADSTRVALAALVAPLIADFYKKNARVPEEQDLKRITKSLEAVLVFSENFTPASDEASRLSTINHAVPLFDSTQVMLVTLQALTPVISAIAEFPFGLSETKFIQDVSDRLEKDAANIAGSDGKFGELLVFKALAKLYAECHLAETERLLGIDDGERAELSTDPIWERYETKLAMVKALTGSGSDSAAVSSQGAAPLPVADVSEDVPVPPSEPPAVEPPPVEAAPIPEAPAEAPPSAAEPAAAPSSGGPMGFFAKQDAASEPPAPAPVEAPAEPVAQDSPQPPAEPVPETPPAATPEPPASAPVEVPAEPPSTDAPADNSAPPSGGGPMSFFKPGPKSDDDNSGAT